VVSAPARHIPGIHQRPAISGFLGSDTSMIARMWSVNSAKWIDA